MSWNTCLNVKSPSKTIDEYSWKVGDLCKAPFSEDGQYYIAEILLIKEWKKSAVVQYQYYENEEEVNMSDMLKLESSPTKVSSSSIPPLKFKIVDSSFNLGLSVIYKFFYYRKEKNVHPKRKGKAVQERKLKNNFEDVITYLIHLIQDDISRLCNICFSANIVKCCCASTTNNFVI